MSEAIATSEKMDSGTMEKVLVSGDLSKLTSPERLNYYGAICRSVGLNPLTRPFEYITLNGKLTLYARKDCTDQLRAIHSVSIYKMEKETIDDVYVVTAYGRNVNGREDAATGAVSVSGLKGEAKANAFMKTECVPLDSEILTRSGWRKYNQIETGDEVLAYDCASDLCQWTPLLAVTVHDSLQMIRLHSKGGQFDVLCTPEHSWAVTKPPYSELAKVRPARGPYVNRKPDLSLVKTMELNTSHKIVLAGRQFQEESALTPVEAAILGWAVTDGTIQKWGTHRRVGICQSKEENFEEIRELVNALSPGIKEIISPAIARIFPSSGRTYETREQHWWYLPSAVSRDLLTKAGFEDHGRDCLPNLTSRLSSPARQAMLQAMMLAEGDKRFVFANTDRNILDSFQMLCALEGIATGTETVKDGTCKTIRKKTTRHVACNFLLREDAGMMPAWCPTTEFGTWIMRQNGRVMVTGNTKAKRRLTLSLCGLGMLDETEIETIPNAQPAAITDPDWPQIGTLKKLMAHECITRGEQDTFDRWMAGDRTEKELDAAIGKISRKIAGYENEKAAVAEASTITMQSDDIPEPAPKRRGSPKQVDGFKTVGALVPDADITAEDIF